MKQKIKAFGSGLVTNEDIERNLRNIEKGKALDMPLAILDGKIKQRTYRRAYQKTDKYKAYQKSEKYKAYRKSEKYKASQKAYQKTDKYKAYQKAYQKTDKRKAYQRAYYQKQKLKEGKQCLG